MTYQIKITGSIYNEDYTFTDPAEGSIKEEVAAILEEMENGNIDSLELSIKQQDRQAVPGFNSPACFSQMCDIKKIGGKRL